MSEENILVIDRAELEQVIQFEQVITSPEPRLCLTPQRMYFTPRAEAEKDPSKKQLIPYVVFFNRNGGNYRILRYSRTKDGGEARLHGKLSLGVGGHINDMDATIDAAIDREIREEISFGPTNNDTHLSLRRHLCGWVNEEVTPVGKVHLGAVYLVELADEVAVSVNETALNNPEFVVMDQLVRESSALELWSQHVLFAMPELVKSYDYNEQVQREFWYQENEACIVFRKGSVAFDPMSFAVEEAAVLSHGGKPYVGVYPCTYGGSFVKVAWHTTTAPYGYTQRVAQLGH